MRNQKIFILAILLSSVFISCEKDVYHNLNNEERRYVVYETGDEILLLRQNEGDTLHFKVVSIETKYNLSLSSSNHTNNYEETHIALLESNDYTITIKISNNYIIDGVLFILHFNKKNSEYHYAEFICDLTPQIIESSDEVFRLYGSDTLLYKKDAGIVYFTSSDFDEKYSFIE